MPKGVRVRVPSLVSSLIERACEYYIDSQALVFYPDNNRKIRQNIPSNKATPHFASAGGTASAVDMPSQMIRSKQDMSLSISGQGTSFEDGHRLHESFSYHHLFPAEDVLRHQVRKRGLSPFSRPAE